MEGERTLSKMAQAEFTVHFAVAKYRLRKLVGTHHSASGRETADLARFGGGRTMVRPYKLAKFGLSDNEPFQGSHPCLSNAKSHKSLTYGSLAERQGLPYYSNPSDCQMVIIAA